MSERYLDANTVEALSRLRGEIQSPFAVVGPWLDVAFPATTARDVQHGLGAVPTGYEIILEVGGFVRAANITAWTTELAFLEADTANTRARLRFVLTLEDPTDA